MVLIRSCKDACLHSWGNQGPKKGEDLPRITQPIGEEPYHGPQISLRILELEASLGSQGTPVAGEGSYGRGGG